MAERVTEVVSAPPQPPPDIKREIVQVPERDAEGNLTGEMVDAERITHHFQYDTKLVPEGDEITLDYKVNGVVISTLGPVVSKPLPGKNFFGQARLVVGDHFDGDKFPEQEAPE